MSQAARGGRRAAYAAGAMPSAEPATMLVVVFGANFWIFIIVFGLHWTSPAARAASPHARA